MAAALVLRASMRYDSSGFEVPNAAVVYIVQTICNNRMKKAQQPVIEPLTTSCAADAAVVAVISHAPWLLRSFFLGCVRSILHYCM